MKFRPIQSWEDYFIPGTTVLRNKFGETDPDRLRAKEEFAAHVRLAELAADPIDGDFDYAHMKAIHRAIFQDVYDWAGVERVGPDTRMTKDGPDVLHYPPGDPNAPIVAYGYYPGPQVAEAAERQYALLAEEHHLLGLTPERFVECLAERWGELNTGGSALLGCELYAYDLPPLDRARNGDRGVRPRGDHRIRGASAKASSSIERSP